MKKKQVQAAKIKSEAAQNEENARREREQKNYRVEDGVPVADLVCLY